MRTPKFCRNSDGRAYATIPRSGGKRVWFGRFDSDEARTAYSRWLRRTLAAAELPGLGVVDVPAGVVSVATLADRFIQHAEATYSAGETGNIVAAIRPLVENFGDLLASEFGPRRLKELQRILIDSGLARSTINARIRKVKLAFRWGVAEEIVAPSVAHGLAAVTGLRKRSVAVPGQKSPREPEPVKPAPWADIEMLLPFLSPVVRAMVQVQLLCGMRPSEVCVMRPADVDRSGPVWIYRPTAHKNEWRDAACVKAIPVAAQSILSPYLNRDATAFCFDPRESDEWSRSQRRKAARNAPIYPCEVKRRESKRAAKAAVRQVGTKRFDRRSYYRSIAYAFTRAKKAGTTVSRWFPHQLRHSIATRLDSAFGRQAAQQWLGHAKLDTTGIYVERQVANLVKLAGEVDRILAVQNPGPPHSPLAEGPRPAT